MRVLTLAACLASAFAAPAMAPVARACGGFFCNAATPVPIIQAGERVLFARHDGLVTMHVEIIYQGDPTQFGWILPLSELPQDASGNPLPLDKAVEVSSQQLFPLLQSRTDPSFTLVRDPNDTTECPQSVSVPSGNFADAAAGDTGGSSSPPVVVLEEAEVGPYDAQLIQAERSDALFEWLGQNGYIQDPAAQPILDHYVTEGFKFLGIRLKSGKSTGDLRPLAITLGEDAPCVPLVLTQIAATPDMPILVWVLGEARAIPKNFIHAVIDERAFAFPGAPNYQSLVSQALDKAGRRAFVTEFAGDAEPFRNMLLPLATDVAYSVGLLERSTNLLEALDAMSRLGIFPGDPDLDSVIRERVPLPEGLKGFPFGNCQYCNGCGEWVDEQCVSMGQPNTEHVTTEGELWGFIRYWAERDAAGEIDLGVDQAALVATLQAEVVTPRKSIEALFAKAKKLTRFFALIDPSEMTRDPIFAFNADLPDVSNQHTAMYDIISCESGTARVTYPDGSTVQTSCGSCASGFASVAAIEGVDPLLHPEVLDEEGAPIPFSPDQAEEIDAILENALPGLPTLPPTFEVTTPTPPVVPGIVKPGESTNDSGCAGGWLVGLLPALLGLLYLVVRSHAKSSSCGSAGTARPS